MTDDEIQALWDDACKDSPQNPGWNRHIRFARALLSKLRAHVADERVGPRHPVVIKWRNNGIEACAGIADAYGIDQAAADMRAMLTKEKGNESSASLGGCPSSNQSCDERSVDRSVRDGSVFGVTHLENALREMIEVAERVDGWQSFPIDPIERARAALASAPVAGEAQEHYDELKATLQGAHRIMEGVSAIERRAGPIGSHARGYTHKITNALRHLDALYAAPQASEAVDRSPNVQGSQVDRSADLQGSASEAVRDEDVAPWPDYAGNPIRHGDRIRHPEGLEGVVVRLPGYADAHDAWCVAYQDRTVSRLSLQIGERGQAVVRAALSAQPGAQRTGGSE